MPPTETLKSITIDDFRPGIRHRVFGGGSSSKQPLGAADPAATFRCRAHPGGYLGPLPKLVQTKTRAALAVASDDVYNRISGFHVTGPLQNTQESSVFAGVDNVEVHQAYEAISGSNHRWYWDRLEVWDDEATVNIRNFLVTHGGSFATLFRPTAFVDHRLHATDPVKIGNLHVVAGWHPDDMNATANIWTIFPDPDTPTSNSIQDILTVNETTIMVSHQGRVVSIDNHVFGHGTGSYWITNDQLVWTEVNLPTSLADFTTGAGVGIFSQGPISGYGAACSASAQELLLVKHRGGASTISGDIDDPTVFSLPGVASTRGATTYGVYTPVGFVYGVKNGGVHAWSGGDTSEKLSEHLDDDFWQMRPSDWRGFDGKFDVWGDYILCPNNWIYEMRTQSWWRIEDPATYQIFQWSAAPQSTMFYGAPVKFSAGGAIYYRFDGSSPEDDYVWQSQYLAPTFDRVIEVREIMLRALAPASGTSTVVVRLIDEAGNTQDETFTNISSTIPKLMRVPTKFQGTGIKVKLTASTTSSNPAPIIFDVTLGYVEAQREAAQSQ